MKLYEARDTFDKGGSTFERAQIVRLDARWIATLRYYLGTGFDDVFIPASGETNSQLGNTLPSQGFIEIAIKDLESMLHIEVSRLWSRGIIQLFTGSRAQYDEPTNALTKYGEYLKVGDSILRRIDEEGGPCIDYHRWRVAELRYREALSINELKVGDEYCVFVRDKQAVKSFMLESVDLDSKVSSGMFPTLSIANGCSLSIHRHIALGPCIPRLGISKPMKQIYRLSMRRGPRLVLTALLKRSFWKI
jgi:hypothetical protein